MTEAEAIEAMARELAIRGECSCAEVPDTSAKFAPCGWCQDAARAALAAIRPYLDAGFAAGAEAMREALRLAAIEKAAWFDAQKTAHCADRADGIRAFLPEIKHAPIPARGDGDTR